MTDQLGQRLTLRDRRPFFVLRGAAAGTHEVELQFALSCAGFQGLRLRRLRGAAGEPERIVCMTVRRALN